MTGESSGVSIVVPAFREGPNLRALIERSFAALGAAGRAGEMIIVDDDSGDESEAIVDELAERFPVRILVRRGRRGLSSAVIEGFEIATYPNLLVMDGDLQHPPEMIPQLAAALDDAAIDFAIATRYAAGGDVGRDWSLVRRLGSRVATLMARPLVPLSDPMSGFFAMRRVTWASTRGVSPIGYKIALELYVKAGCVNPVEIPISFGVRTAGKSKLTGGVFARYLWHLVSLYRYRYPVLSWMLPFSVILLIGVLVFFLQYA